MRLLYTFAYEKQAKTAVLSKTAAFFCFSQAKTHKNPYIYNKISDKVQLFQKNFMMEKGEKNKGVSRMPDTDGNCLFVKLFKIKFLIFV